MATSIRQRRPWGLLAVALLPVPVVVYFGLMSHAPAAEVLRGTWIREDGGYRLVVRETREDGFAAVDYFNPDPVRVGRASTRVVDRRILELFVELQDRNYPGSTYTLTLDPDRHELRGGYYQAVERRTFDVVFRRAP